MTLAFPKVHLPTVRGHYLFSQLLNKDWLCELVNNIPTACIATGSLLKSKKKYTDLLLADCLDKQCDNNCFYSMFTWEILQVQHSICAK